MKTLEHQISMEIGSAVSKAYMSSERRIKLGDKIILFQPVKQEDGTYIFIGEEEKSE
jgi:hypothetical protein